MNAAYTPVAWAAASPEKSFIMVCICWQHTTCYLFHGEFSYPIALCVQIKPDGVQRGLIADIIKRFEQKGYKLVAIKARRANLLLHACTGSPPECDMTRRLPAWDLAVLWPAFGMLVALKCGRQ